MNNQLKGRNILKRMNTWDDSILISAMLSLNVTKPGKQKNKTEDVTPGTSNERQLRGDVFK